MMCDEFPEFGGKSPQTLGGSPVNLYLYVEDVDTFYNKAVAAGAKASKPVMDQFYGDRSGQLEDPFGHLWWVSTHKEDVPPEEMQKRMQAAPPGREEVKARRGNVMIRVILPQHLQNLAGARARFRST